MRNEFICECKEIKEFYAPITEGPPEEVLCDSCNGKMWQNYGTNVVFKGEGWIDKDLRREKGDDGQAIEHHEESMRVHKEKKQTQNEVLNERRKGTKHMREWSKKNPAKWRDYKNNIDVGIRGENE